MYTAVFVLKSREEEGKEYREGEGKRVTWVNLSLTLMLLTNVALTLNIYDML